MNLAFFGSRSLKIRKKEVLDIIDKEIKKHNPDLIITSGGIKGVCDLVETYCKRNREGIPIKLVFPNFNKRAAGAYGERSYEIIREADFVVIIHDGKSRGTKNELAEVKAWGKRYEYYVIDIDNNVDGYFTNGLDDVEYIGEIDNEA